MTNSSGDSATAHVVSPKSAPKLCRPAKAKEEIAGKAVCQVAGCSRDLLREKCYFQRYRCCELHLRSLSIVVNGAESRFCQQCGRFQEIHEFDGVRRSCRAKLLSHNQRRRAIAAEATLLSDTMLSGLEDLKNVPVISCHTSVPVISSHTSVPVISSHTSVPVISSHTSVVGLAEECGLMNEESQPHQGGGKPEQMLPWSSKPLLGGGDLSFGQIGSDLVFDDEMGIDLDLMMNLDTEGFANFTNGPPTMDNDLGSFAPAAPDLDMKQPMMGADGRPSCSFQAPPPPMDQGWKEGGAMNMVAKGMQEPSSSQASQVVSYSDMNNDQLTMQRAFQSMKDSVDTSDSMDISIAFMSCMPPMNMNRASGMSGNTATPVYCPPNTPAPAYCPPNTPAPAYRPPNTPAPAYCPPMQAACGPYASGGMNLGMQMGNSNSAAPQYAPSMQNFNGQFADAPLNFNFIHTPTFNGMQMNVSAMHGSDMHGGYQPPQQPSGAFGAYPGWNTNPGLEGGDAVAARNWL